MAVVYGLLLALFLGALIVFIYAEPLARRMRKRDGGKFNRTSPQWGDGVSAYVIYIRMRSALAMLAIGAILFAQIHRALL